MKKVLCLVVHPGLQQSRANARILESMRGLPNVTFHFLYDLYPEFYIDVKKEQELLASHDSLVIQHPFYWYSMPPLLKLWFDSVLEYNWAYGPEGKALAGKDFMLSITAGGPLDSYDAGGINRFHTEAFFPPYEQTARICGMHWHKPSVLHDANKVSEENLIRHSEKIRDRVSAMITGAR